MALHLLKGYESDSSSTSEEDLDVIINSKRKHVNQTITSKRKKITESAKIIKSPNISSSDSKERNVGENLPLPPSISAMFNQTNKYDDDPNLHGGRVRSFGHEKNNWATYIYVDFQDSDFDDIKELIVRELDLEPINNYHLSISRVVSLRHHWIDPLIISLKSEIEKQQQFHVTLDKLQVYTNDDKTRTFVGLETKMGVQQLKKLSNCVDVCFNEYRLPPFYNPPSFHVSLGWCLGNKMSSISSRLSKVELRLVDLLDDGGDIESLLVKNVVCKSGNKVFQINLKKP